jgi:hypothetical protein
LAEADTVRRLEKLAEGAEFRDNRDRGAEVVP